MISEELLFQQQSHQDEAVSQHQSNFSDQSSNKFSEFIQSLSPSERLLELDNQDLQANFSLKEHTFSLTLDAAEKHFSHILQKNKQIADKRLKKNWTDDETSLLLWIVEVFSHRLDMDPADFETSSWVEIAQMIPFKAFDNCKLRWLYLKKNCVQGVPWAPEEDECLIQIIKKKGTDSNKWNEIAKELQNSFAGKSFRKGKQCRERWNNHLDPDMKRGDWTCQEDLKLLQLSYEKGNKWSYIARQLQERTENAVKNRYKSLIRKEEKELKATQKNETILEYNYSPEELMKLIGVDSVENQSPEQLKLLGIIKKLINSIEESKDENAIEIEEEVKERKENCAETQVQLKDNLEESKNQGNNESATPTSTKTESTPKTELHFSNNKTNNQSTTTLPHSIFSPLSSPIKPLFSTIQSASSVESSTKLIAPNSSKPFDQQKNNIAGTTEKQKKCAKQRKESKKKPEVSTFSEAFLKEKNTAKRGSQESNFSNSTASSFSQGIQLVTQQFPHRTSIQSCGTPGSNSAFSSNNFYSPLLPSVSPCSLLIQQFNNLGFSSCENTPTVKRRNTCLNGSDPLQTLLCLDIIHKQRKLSSMAEEQEILSPSSISTPSTRRKVIVLAKDKSLSEEQNDDSQHQLNQNVPIETKSSNTSCQDPSVTAKTHSQISSDDSLSPQDDSRLCAYPNLLQYSGPNKSAFRQFLSPLQVSKPSPLLHHLIPVDNQNNTNLNNPFSQFNKISPLLICPPLTTTTTTTPTQPALQQSQGFTKNKNFKSLLPSIDSKQDHLSIFKQSSQAVPCQLASSSSFQSVSKEDSKLE